MGSKCLNLLIITSKIPGNNFATNILIMDSNSTEGSLVSEENPSNGLSTVASNRQHEENPVIEQSAVANSGQYEVARPFFSYLLGMYLIVIGNYKSSFALLSGVTGDIEPNETLFPILFSGSILNTLSVL